MPNLKDKIFFGAFPQVTIKLINGTQGDSCDHLMWSPLDYLCNDGPKGPDCDPYCLYNIVKDPEERTVV